MIHVYQSSHTLQVGIVRVELTASWSQTKRLTPRLHPVIISVFPDCHCDLDEIRTHTFQIRRLRLFHLSYETIKVAMIGFEPI